MFAATWTSLRFVESFAVNGVLVPFRITPDGEAYRVIDGGRRLAAAIKAGVTEVPYDLVEERAGDEACEYLDMINANRHRNPLTAPSRKPMRFSLRKEAGRRQDPDRQGNRPDQRRAQQRARRRQKLSEQARARVEDLDEQLTLDELAVLAEFDGDKRRDRAADAGGFHRHAGARGGTAPPGPCRDTPSTSGSAASWRRPGT